MSNKHCIACGKSVLTWAEQRRQFAIAIQRVKLDKAKQVMTRCGKCLTKMVGPRKFHTAAPLKEDRGSDLEH
jgi:hypothetical protein